MRKLLLQPLIALLMSCPALSLGQALESPSIDRPYEGFWLVPGEPGSGLVIDQEGDTLVITVFAYRTDGSPIWYLASGPLVDGTFEASALEFSGGSCIGCVWTHPESQKAATIQLDFVGRVLGWFSWNKGESKPIRAFAFDQPRHSVYGIKIGPFGSTSSFDLRGRWVFVDKESQLDPFGAVLGGPIWGDGGGVALLGWWERSPNGLWLDCIDRGSGPANRAQCQVGRFDDEGGESEILFSSFWGDIGPEALIGYTGEALEGTDNALRRDQRFAGFRLTGPGARDSDPVQSPFTPIGIHKGAWYTPGQPGSGLMIDWQYETVLVAVFTYRNGEPVWYLGSGSPDDNGLVEFDLQEFKDGSCPGCPYQPAEVGPDRIPARLDFRSSTTGTFQMGESEQLPIRALPFDSPRLTTFGVSGPFGQPLIYDLEGEWLFVSIEGHEQFLKRVTFSDRNRLRGGSVVRWSDIEGKITFRCDANREFVSPQCRLIERNDEGWRRLLSAHWADVGPDRIIGYLEMPLDGSNGQFRGEDIVYGFRISSPD